MTTNLNTCQSSSLCSYMSLKFSESYRFALLFEAIIYHNFCMLSANSGFTYELKFALWFKCMIHFVSQLNIFYLFSTVTTWQKVGEIEAFRNMLTKFPEGYVAVVSDSYDVWHACESIWGGALKDLVVQRGKRGGALVIRPDSGDPPEVVVKVLKCLV